MYDARRATVKKGGLGIGAEGWGKAAEIYSGSLPTPNPYPPTPVIF